MQHTLNTQKAEIFRLGADSHEPFGQHCPDHPALRSVSIRQQFWEAELPGKEPRFSRTSRLQTHTEEFRTLSWKGGVAEEIPQVFTSILQISAGINGGGFHAVLQLRISAGFTAAARTGELLIHELGSALTSFTKLFWIYRQHPSSAGGKIHFLL